MTEKEFYQKIIEKVSDKELTDFAEKKLSQIDARNEKRVSTLTKNQVENLGIIESIENFLKQDGNFHRASEISENLGLKVQKINALLKLMEKSGTVIVDTAKIRGKGIQKIYKISEQLAGRLVKIFTIYLKEKKCTQLENV